MSTTKFLFLYRAPVDAAQSKMAAGWQPSPEEMQAMYAQWSAWKAKFEKEIVGSDGLKPGGAAAVYKGGTVSDGPYIESKEVMGGYTFIVTSSIERAIEIARECPINRQPGASVEIRELAQY